MLPPLASMKICKMKSNDSNNYKSPIDDRIEILEVLMSSWMSVVNCYEKKLLNYYC